ILIIFPLFNFIEYASSKIIDGVVFNVTSDIASNGRKKSTVTRPTIKFERNDSIKYYTPKELISITKYNKGDKVKLIYPENKPENLHIYSFSTFWFPIWDIIIMTILEVILFGVFSIITRKYDDE
ncbi:MAG: hypothetical protein H7Y00_07225, partial [Fimbriimonadaceae bacterium]|nr:hypothetical protein [Chitinophagales bacterium]